MVIASQSVGRSVGRSSCNGQKLWRPKPECVLSTCHECPRPRLTIQQEHEAKITQSSGQEALSHAIRAAELYMKAVKEAPTTAAKSRLKRKCHDLIALAETLKTLKLTPTPAPAPAPAAALSAAASTPTPTPSGSTAASSSSSSSKAPKPKGPRQTRSLPTNEKTILLRSSKLHGNVFPPWDNDPDPAGFRSRRLDEPLFV